MESKPIDSLRLSLPFGVEDVRQAERPPGDVVVTALTQRDQVGLLVAAARGPAEDVVRVAALHPSLGERSAAHQAVVMQRCV